MRSSGSNGVTERAVKEVGYELKTMKSSMDEKLNTNIGTDAKILTWMIEYASVLINRYLVGKDGKTAYERLKA